MTDTATSSPPTVRRSRGILTGLVLVVGVLVIPMALGIIFNSWEAPDAAAYVRMAFASIAGATVGIVTVWGLVVWDLVHRNGLAQILTATLIAVVITFFAGSNVAAATETLLQRLSTLA